MTAMQYIEHLSTSNKTVIIIFAMNCNNIFTGIDLETIHKIANEHQRFFIVILVLEAQYSTIMLKFAKQTKSYLLHQNCTVWCLAVLQIQHQNLARNLVDAFRNFIMRCK